MSKLRADLIRFRKLNNGPDSPVSGPGLWLTCLHPRVIPVVLLRIAESADRSGLGGIAKLFAIFNLAIFGLEVSPKVAIGGGLFLPHTVGTVIGAESIGENCTIFQGVTLGASEMDLQYSREKRPVIGNNVLIGAGAKVIGPVRVGDHAKIGANAVVVKDVPSGVVAIGVPATWVAPPAADFPEAK